MTGPAQDDQGAQVAVRPYDDLSISPAAASGYKLSDVPVVQSLPDGRRGDKHPGGKLAMSTFERREKGFEAKWKQDQELRFKVMARRNKLLGLWAAQQFGMDDGEAEVYAKAVVMADFDRPGDDDVLDKVHADFGNHGIEMSEHRVRKEMDRLMDEAARGVEAELSQD